MLLVISLESYRNNSTHTHTHTHTHILQNKLNYIHVCFVGGGSNSSKHERYLTKRHAEQNLHFSGDNV